MKKHNIFKVVCIAIAVTILLTWILPVTYFSDAKGLVETAREQLGLFNFFGYLAALVSYFGYIPMYLLIIGGFYGVLYKTDAYRNLLDRIVKKYKGNEWIFLTLVMILFAVITSVSGLYLGLLFLLPFVITVILLMGYSKVTALLTTVGSICVGLIGTTYSLNDLQYVHDYLSLSASSEIVAKLVILVVGLILLIVNTLLYARKHRINEPRKGFLYPESKNTKAKVWPIVVVFDVTLVIMILAFISWTSAFNVDFFTKVSTAIQNYKIGGFAIFSKLLGRVVEFGSWQVNDLAGLLLISTGFVALMCKVKFNDMIDSFVKGAKRALRPALVTTLIYMLVFITAYHPIVLTMIKPLAELTKTMNIATMSAISFISHLFNVEMYYSASCTLPYIVSVFTDTKVYGIIGVIWQAMYGFGMLFVPSSAVLVAALSYLNVSYFKWLKAVWKLLLELLVVLLIIFLILVMI